jgi:putative tryptophan/tyrosine transport system substrate-binding protein
MMSSQADKILKGAAPDDLPVGVVTRRERVFNLKTAREVGVAAPPDLQKRADRVIQ